MTSIDNKIAKHNSIHELSVIAPQNPKNAIKKTIEPSTIIAIAPVVAEPPVLFKKKNRITYLSLLY